VAAAAVAVPRDAHAAEKRTWHYLTTGNGHGFQVFSEEKHRVTQFLEHPYRYIAPASVPAVPPEREGVGRRNLAFDVFFGVKGGGWLSDDASGDSPEYVDQSNIIRVPATVGGTKAESFYFAPFGLERNVMVGLLHAPGASDGYALFNFHMGDGRLEPNANGESMRAVSGVPKAIVETGPGGGAMIYVPIGGADHADCQGVFDKGKNGQDLADKSDCSGSDITAGFQKKLGADGWMGFATAYVENAGEADAVAAEINTWVKARTPDKVLDDAKKEFEAWRKPAPADVLCSDDEKKLWRQGEAVLRMGQVREANTATRKNHGMVLASLPIGEWHTGWVRDATYAVTALARMGHLDEARLALDFFLNAFEMNPGGIGKYKSYVNNQDYRISVVRYYGTGEEEADTNQDGPNVETDGWGLVLWAARQYVEAAGADGVAWLEKPTFKGTVWETLLNGLAKPIEGNLEQPTFIMGKDSSIWEVHDAKKRHYAYTTLTAARGLCDMAGIAKKANKADAAHYQDIAKKVREGFVASFVDPQGALAGSIEGLSQGKYIDGAVAEAFTWNILQDWKGDTAKATLDLLGKLKVDSGGYKRNDDGLSSYDNNEWILVDLRIANALRRAGRTAEADGIVAHVVNKAAANFYLVPELYNDTAGAGATGDYTGSIPMVGYGGGAFVLTVLDRSGISEANDCGDGKGATLPKITCSAVSTNPGGPGTDADGGAGAGPNGGVPDASQVPFVSACLCVLGPDRGIPPYGLALFLSVPVLLLARRGLRRRR
jgi:GH15 family glucan-1,4-alpha-glucosidase